MRLLTLLLFVFLCQSGLAQSVKNDAAASADKPAAPLASRDDYRPTPEKLFSLVHTKLEVKFDFAQKRMPGKAWITLKPHFYDQDKLVLDAKGMFIHELGLWKNGKVTPLSFDYKDSLQLIISLDKKYSRNETLTVFVAYTARPDEIKLKGSLAISNAKGLYFINPDGKDSTKPVQIWTQGETEATSVWCPTIDRPNQKTTQEITMTVPARFVTLSNGTMTKQQKNPDGTRTDTWKMDQPHAPYLFFMGVGAYAVIKDKYKNLPVDYYVDSAYARVAKSIFGNTPEMIDYFSKLLNYPYPWVKYAQMVAEDYVSGAMENTTSTLHGSAAYQNARQLKDENRWEIVVAHELFHQWFGDLVTTESWSNLPMNESFADYSEYLWLEYKYGKDHALAYNNDAMKGYFSNPANASRHLVRFTYGDKEEMFDAVSYQKGGRIMNMLRQYVGDSAFFQGMNLYLKQNKFKTGEAHQFRLALEEVSGKDLNWFFDQWFFGSGHPKALVKYVMNDQDQKIKIIIEQQQKEKLFYLPLNIDIYTNGKASRMTHWIGRQSIDTILINYETKPDWIDIDPDRLVLWEKKIEQNESYWLAQGRFAKNHIQKIEVLEYLESFWKDTLPCREIIASFLTDPYFGTRKAALNVLRRGDIKPDMAAISYTERIAKSDPDAQTRAAAIDLMGTLGHQGYEGVFRQYLKDSSYSIAGAALEALARINAPMAIQLADAERKDMKGRLEASVKVTEFLEKSPDSATSVLADYKKQQLIERVLEANAMLHYANRLANLADFKKAAGSAIENYKFLRIDYQGLKTITASTIGWMITQREEALKKNPQDKIAEEQLKYLKEKMGR